MELLLNITNNLTAITTSSSVMSATASTNFCFSVWQITLILVFLIIVSAVVRRRFSKDWQQILWSYFGVILLAVAMAKGYIIA